MMRPMVIIELAPVRHEVVQPRPKTLADEHADEPDKPEEGRRRRRQLDEAEYYPDQHARREG